MTGLDNRVESLDSLSLQAWSQKAVISLTFRGVEHIHLIVARLAKRLARHLVAADADAIS